MNNCNRFQTPLRCICRTARPECTTTTLRGPNVFRRTPRRMSTGTGMSMSFLSLASDESERSVLSAMSYDHQDGSDSMSSLDASSAAAAASLVEPIDDLMEELVAEATQNWATTSSTRRSALAPEQQVMELAVERLDIDVSHLKDAHDAAGKTFYQLRLVSANNNNNNFDSHYRDFISSVLIGYACLKGIDQGYQKRQFTFQDSRHLYLFCELLGQTGRFEDAAF